MIGHVVTPFQYNISYYRPNVLICQDVFEFFQEKPRFLANTVDLREKTGFPSSKMTDTAITVSVSHLPRP
jgi:hypothetical protein